MNYDIQEVINNQNLGGAITLRVDVPMSQAFDCFDYRSTAGYLFNSSIRVILHFNCSKYQFKDYNPNSYLSPRIYYHQTKKFVSLLNKKVVVWGKVKDYQINKLGIHLLTINVKYFEIE